MRLSQTDTPIRISNYEVLCFYMPKRKSLVPLVPIDLKPGDLEKIMEENKEAMDLLEDLD
jgi:hypothetical protein